jgi:GAF domain-containing protein
VNLIQGLDDLIRRAPSYPAAAEIVCKTLRKDVAHYSWVGIYMVEGDDLVLKAWDGPQATEHVRIPIGKGVCGRAARTHRTEVVDDVAKDPEYLACFISTRAEIVVPIMKAGRCIGEIDIDSDKVKAFDTLDRLFLEWLADRLAEKSA